MPKRRFSLETVYPSNEDTRSDTTRKGYHEGRVPFGAGYGPAADSPYALIEFIGSRGPIEYDPNLITGIAPTPNIIPAKASNAFEALQIVNAMRKKKQAARIAKAAKQYGMTPETYTKGVRALINAINSRTGKIHTFTKPKRSAWSNKDLKDFNIDDYSSISSNRGGKTHTRFK